LIALSVDLRPDLQPVRHQGRRQSCLAFASSAAHEHQVGVDEYLSVEYLFYHSVARTAAADPSVGTTMMAAAAALADEGQPVEAAWPYSPVQTTPWTPPTIATKLYKTTMVPGKFDFDEIVTMLDQGRPVVLGLVITDAFYRPDKSGRILDQSPDTERAGHAVLGVGHAVSAEGMGILLIRNSWGVSWGLGGHAWLSRTYLGRQLHETALLT
jgi:C1A family cysteine protease